MLSRVRALVGARVLADGHALWFDTVNCRLHIARDDDSLVAPKATAEGSFLGDLACIPFDLANEGSRTGLALLHTGFNRSFSLDAAWVRAKGLGDRIRPSSNRDMGLAGAVSSPGEIPVKKVRFWPPSQQFFFRSPVGVIPLTAYTSRYGEPRVAARVGWAALVSFSPVFDYAQHRVRLYSSSGFSLGSEADRSYLPNSGSR